MGNAQSSSLEVTAIKVAAVTAASAAASWAYSSFSERERGGQSESERKREREKERANRDAESSSLGDMAIVAAAAAAAAACAYSSFSEETASQKNPPLEGNEELQMRQVPEDYRIRRLDNDQIMLQQHLSLYTIQGHTDSGSNNTMLKILSYNVWFREDLEVHKRMKAVGDLIQQHLPDLICLQEVTPSIYEIFRHSGWWKMYKCSLSQEMAVARPYFCMQLSKLPVKAFKRRPFDNSIMGRELCMAEIDVGMNKKLIVATSHLESPSPAPPKWDQMYSKERVVQAKESVGILKDFPNVIFGGDMNWDEKLDGSFPLNGGWVDAWDELKAGENGWTYDTKSNQMLSGNRTLQKRLDRFICNLKDFKIESIEMIGKEAIPGISYCKEKKVKKEVKKLELPVLPSDHYGLLLTIRNL